MMWGARRRSQGLARGLIPILTEVIGLNLRFDVLPPNFGVGGFGGLFNGTDRVLDLFGGQVIGEIQGQRDQHVRGPKTQSAHFVEMVDFGRRGVQRADAGPVSG